MEKHMCKNEFLFTLTLYHAAVFQFQFYWVPICHRRPPNVVPKLRCFSGQGCDAAQWGAICAAHAAHAAHAAQNARAILVLHCMHT
jgi:hypothetical protein